MCGIYGIINSRNFTQSYYFNGLEPVVKKLFRFSLSRGSEAAGLIVVGENKINLIKSTKKIKNFLQNKDYKVLKRDILNEKIKLVMGHTRMPTHGSSEDNKNNQPVISKNRKIIGIHNGIIVNYKSLQKNQTKIPELDTQVLLDYLEGKIDQIKSKQELFILFDNLVKKIEGTANLALFLREKNQLLLYSNNGSLYYLEKNDQIYFASERSTLEKIFLTKPTQIKEKLLVFDFEKKENKYTLKDFSSNGGDFDQKKYFVNKIEILKKHQIDYQKISKIKRCTKCILPETTPFIKFDELGVCNYCLEHKKISYLGKNKLEDFLEKYRNKNGKIDCLVAFSGGRDSSYGLHLIKKELGLNPIAFTYDWGMISDLGRRNQARVLGKLGVEQILVSANIAKKRKDIRENILAWIKNPDLGMVPLFMQGDKQCEYYADQVMRKYKIPLMIYCRGNELEKEEFKSGLCGVKEADPDGVIHNIATLDKIKLLSYYGKQYLKNPSYFNSSIFDTAFGYFSTYLKPHDYLYLWHYLPWQEDEIVKTLTKEYNWEMSEDTSTSWRIGDGTPAFYNYIYYQVQGFTENDSFRSRQIREGILSREKALELVKKENEPQYNNLRWYFDTLNLDGDKILNVIDKMKKKYE